MKDKGRTRGTFKVYLQWPLFLSVLLVILTAAVIHKGWHYSIGIYHCLYRDCPLALLFKKKRHTCRAHCIFIRL